jgi:hypothetical protein
MDPFIIDNIPFKPEIDSIAEYLKIKPGSSRMTEIEHLVADAMQIARPKVLSNIVSVQGKGEDQVLLDGKPFTSRILRKNLSEVNRAFPYVITCGIELYNWVKSFEDLFTSYLADAIALFALDEAQTQYLNYLSNHYGLTKTGTMNPGSLEDWPIEAQIPLFDLLGDPQGAIGVNLTESLLMIPRQSVSGILFETEKDFVNCQLCPREVCSSRRAPYDPEIQSAYLD